MAQVRIADLPNTSVIDPQSYVIIERPEIGEGTFKSTVGDLQKAITVTANVTQEGQLTRIYISDINGETEAYIVTPTANVVQEGVNTTITITDALGETQAVIVTPTANVVQKDNRSIITITDAQGETQTVVTTPIANVTQEREITTITIEDAQGQTQAQIFTPIANVRDNGDGTSTISITDTKGETSITVVNAIIIDPKPIEDSNNVVTSGTVYSIDRELRDRIELLESVVSVVYNMPVENESGHTILTEDNQILLGPAYGTIQSMRESGGQLNEPFRVGENSYESLSAAIMDAAVSGGSVRLVSNGSDHGISIPEGSNFKLDLNGNTLTLVGPGAGSPGTQTLAMQLLKDSNITISNGTIFFDDPQLKMGIQNYSNLTLDNVTVIGGPTITYVVSNNYGNIVFKNGTTITPYGNNVAFDAWYGMSAVYDGGVNITIATDDVKINGIVEFGKARRASLVNFHDNASITCPEQMDLTVRLLTTPCKWTVDEEARTKTLRYDLQV